VVGGAKGADQVRFEPVGDPVEDVHLQAALGTEQGREQPHRTSPGDDRDPRVIEGARPDPVDRSRRRLQTHLLLARGIANAYLASDLAFDAAEITQLAAAYDVACDEHDLAQVLSDTEGWPLAAHWLVRDAAQNGRPLSDAFTCWREANGHLLLEFVENERQEDADAFAAFARVLTAGGGREALLLAEEDGGMIDLLLSDLVMPGTSGRELAEQIQAIRPDISILYMSGYTDDAVIRRGVLEAVMAVIQKPFGAEDLGRRVREVIDGRSGRKAAA